MIFVIGGNGFVGSAICRELNRKNLEYEVLTRQNIDSFRGKECDIVINANGNSKKFIANEDPIREFNESVLSVRESLENIKYKKYIYLSSCDVYEDCSSPTLTKEETCIDIKNQSTYGFHKYLAEQCVQHVAENWIIFRMGGFVGEGLKKNAIYDILNGGPLWLSPDSELQFIHTDEAAHIIVELASSEITREIYNLCGNGVVKLRDVMDQLNVNIEVKENSQIVKYEACIDKLSERSAISNTTDTVLKFVREKKR